ncbi:chromosome segregation protein [Aquimarina aggregata]|uniref:Chromosome segregation protein n=1 Tax=Aquimarina aggregata TaxID=1642818 RepID=A0A163AUS7_9FLAO|nr:chromosome segregation protein [Aquimarina aggregata]
MPKADGEKDNKAEILKENSEVNTTESAPATPLDTGDTISKESSEEQLSIEKSEVENTLENTPEEPKESEVSDLDSTSTTANPQITDAITQDTQTDVIKSKDDDVTEVSDVKNDEVQDQMDEAVAEHSEDETTQERHDIEKKDYHAMTKEQLIKELSILVKNEKIQAIKEHVEEIKTEFNEKFNEEVEQKKEEFLAEGGNVIDFYYSTPIKKEFNSVYFDYKEKRNAYYQNLKKDLQENLKRRLELIDELKGLLNVDENINTTYNHFKSIQERWRNAGPIPRDKYNTVWNTYHHHTENFYDFLHLNREFRDLDFKHNLEQKLKIIERATELAQETDVNRAFRELQLLHKMWKEDLGPVGKEYREPIWEKFSALTKQIHENRQKFFKEQDKVYEVNLETKRAIIAQIVEVAKTSPNNHSGWQQKIKEIEALREEFFKAGKVPSYVNEQTWSEFKSAVRDFNRNKNAFYKGLKKEQFLNLNKKMELIQIAEDNKDSDDFSVTTPLMKKIQADWKKIGHVPRKDSDRIWKRFKDACNSYFDRIHAERNEANKEELVSLEKKQSHIEALKDLKLSGDPAADLKTIKDNISVWKTLGRVPYKKKNIESEYNKALDGLFQQLNLSRQETEMIKYENKLSSLSNQSDDSALRNEQNFIRKKIDEVNGEIRQLENNLQFFKNAKDDNPLVLEVHKNIEKHRDSLEVWKAKLKKIKQL